ncbi:MAG: CGLD27 family protein, partial [Cyanobacteria bacterium]|nr:CGLD27 family protein [Cyanobacteriota bacterium]
YEESGWYDGQVWEKPVAWRQQDLLVATHQVKPVLQRLRRTILITLVLLLVGTGLCQAF